MLTDVLQLSRPLVSLDCETTGVDYRRDRIVQLGVVKVHPDGSCSEWETLINPELSIPKEATDVHHITDEMVRDAPTFRQLANKIMLGLANCDVLGYNVHSFDVKIIKAEMMRVGVEWEPGRVVDAYKIWQRVHPRNLTEAVKHYLSTGHEDAHGALADARAVVHLIEAQLLQHPELPRSVNALHTMFFETAGPGALDPDRKIIWKNGEACIAFGDKHNGNSLKMIAATDKKFLQWILSKDFSPIVKTIVRDALSGKFPVPPAAV